MPVFLEEVRYAVRILTRNPSFTAVVVLTLALGIGANSTIFSWISSTLLNPIPGATRTSELISMTEGEENDFSYPDYKDLEDANQGFSGLAAFKMSALDLTGTGKPERIWGALVSANYFDVLGVQTILGRRFLPSEDERPGGEPVAVISYRLWQTHFGADSSVIGRTIPIDQHPYTIIGVTPPLFQGSDTGLHSDLWIPLAMEQQVVSNSDRLHDRGKRWLELLGRLKPNHTLLQTQQEMKLLMRRIATEYPDSHQGNNDIALSPLWRSPYGANSRLATLLPPLMAIAGAVLLVACANVANLLLVRSVSRRREFAIRMSLGASRCRLVRQLLVESLILSVAGGGIALLIASWTAGTFANFIPPTNLPISLNMREDRSVFLMTLAISVLAAVISGILPALRSSGVAPVRVLKEETGSASSGPHKARLSSGFVVAQIALSLFLLVCAGLFLRSMRSAEQFNPGFNSNHVLLASFDLFPAGYSGAGGLEFDRQLLGKLEALPGVQSVTLADWVPLGFFNELRTVHPEGYVPRLHESMDAGDTTVAPNYFRTMQISLVSGRDFTFQDTEKSQPVVIVNQALADRYWPHQEVLGKRLNVDGQWRTIVGVARNSSTSRHLYEAPRPFVYLPLFQDYSRDEIIHVRVSGDPLALAGPVEKVVHLLNADLPVFNVTTLSSHVQLSSIGYRIEGTFVGAFGLLALVLAAVGIYGVISYTARQRTHEIGIRIALGAQGRNVMELVLRQGVRLTLIGLATGLLLSLVVTRFLSDLLFGVTATDAWTYASVASLLTFVALAACTVPARRAMKVDPMVALRYE
jgi:predicted permease